MCNDEVSVLGYTHWSLLDSFEFTSGYSYGSLIIYGLCFKNYLFFRAKFGLVEVDFNSKDLTRTLKNSAYYYSNLIETNSINATDV